MAAREGPACALRGPGCPVPPQGLRACGVGAPGPPHAAGARTVPAACCLLPGLAHLAPRWASLGLSAPCVARRVGGVAAPSQCGRLPRLRLPAVPRGAFQRAGPSSLSCRLLAPPPPRCPVVPARCAGPSGAPPDRWGVFSSACVGPARGRRSHPLFRESAFGLTDVLSGFQGPTSWFLISTGSDLLRFRPGPARPPQAAWRHPAPRKPPHSVDTAPEGAAHHGPERLGSSDPPPPQWPNSAASALISFPCPA